MRGPALLALLASAAVLAAGCGGAKTTSPTPETVEGTIPREEAPDLAQGNAEAGREVFNTTANPACGTCHTFQAAGSTGTLGPDLDQSLQGQDAEAIYESIVNPDAEIAEGFQPNVMPKDYGQKLSDKQLADLVAFLTPQS
jgi:mono/diheme cytochrome c family protein